ncbi:hypothetical protein PPYR_14752 [Photinus pyralis]|uniref:acid phosphatase n=1 Tax=Photinus pyralis TaxID=7054 RepID=A0A5N4A649_PHOPY|nr:hypothetical protein PPYR_14752 [Photinus pyralis]
MLSAVVACCFLALVEDCTGELVLVHAVFRHGERTPTGFYPFDPHRNVTFYPMGLGNLTNKGKLMMFKLGELLRSMYGELLGDVYQESKVYARSRFVTRTKESALLVLAGMWPPGDVQRWHPTLSWMPIAVEFKRAEEEDLLDPVCEQLQSELISYYKNVTIQEKYIKPYRSVFKYIQKHSGKVINDFRDAAWIYFILKMEEDNGLKLPKWTKEIYPEPLQKIVAFQYVYKNLENKYKIMNSGHLIKKILDDTMAKVKNILEPPDRRVFLYSGHETTIGNLLYNLNVFKLEVPTYGDTVLIEVHRRNVDHFVKVRYLRTPLNSTVEDLEVPGCGKICPVQRFYQIQVQRGVLPGPSFRRDCY